MNSANPASDSFNKLCVEMNLVKAFPDKCFYTKQGEFTRDTGLICNRASNDQIVQIIKDRCLCIHMCQGSELIDDLKWNKFKTCIISLCPQLKLPSYVLELVQPLRFKNTDNYKSYLKSILRKDISDCSVTDVKFMRSLLYSLSLEKIFMIESFQILITNEKFTIFTDYLERKKFRQLVQNNNEDPKTFWNFPDFNNLDPKLFKNVNLTLGDKLAYDNIFEYLIKSSEVVIDDNTKFYSFNDYNYLLEYLQKPQNAPIFLDTFVKKLLAFALESTFSKIDTELATVFFNKLKVLNAIKKAPEQNQVCNFVIDLVKAIYNVPKKFQKSDSDFMDGIYENLDIQLKNYN
ncbi:MAG: hypothetical protein JHC93_08205, partial [Parachlamydiales bacterium]|nr:hypothetical protein [Parachlamydiales bacterium]